MRAKPNEILITRIYDAPVKLVWEAWTDLEHVGKWWGPRGFTITTKSKDLRPGGKWIYTMHGPDGTDYPNIATYHEVVKYEKLVYDHGGNEERPKLFSVSVTFKENNGKTTMAMTMILPTAEEAEQTKKFIKMANGNSTWDRLGEYLGNELEGKDSFLINRSFNADIKSVFQMWANPEKFTAWLGPQGSTAKFLRVNVTEGGEGLWEMAMDGHKHGMLKYKKINAPHHMVYSQWFCDKDGKFIKAPFNPNYPDTLLTTVTFAEEEDGNQTRVTVKWEIHGEATPIERQTFHEMKTVMMGGWSQSFDKIDSLLT